MIVSMQKGVARGIFSNEAGLGSAPIAAAAAQTKEPVRQGKPVSYTHLDVYKRQQIYQSGFSASCTTDNTYGLSLCYRKTDMRKTGGTGFAVLKGYVIEYDGIFRK